MFGLLKNTVVRSQPVVRNAVNRQVARNYGADIQVGRPRFPWGEYAMWKKGLAFSPFLFIIWYPSWYVTKNLRKHKEAKEAQEG